MARSIASPIVLTHLATYNYVLADKLYTCMHIYILMMCTEYIQYFIHNGTHSHDQENLHTLGISGVYSA